MKVFFVKFYFHTSESSIVINIHSVRAADQVLVFESVSTTECREGCEWEKQNSDGAPNLSFPLQRTIFVTMVGS